MLHLSSSFVVLKLCGEGFKLPSSSARNYVIMLLSLCGHHVVLNTFEYAKL